MTVQLVLASSHSIKDLAVTRLIDFIRSSERGVTR
jgi:hypothetical protein